MNLAFPISADLLITLWLSNSFLTLKTIPPHTIQLLVQNKHILTTNLALLWSSIKYCTNI